MHGHTHTYVQVFYDRLYRVLKLKIMDKDLLYLLKRGGISYLDKNISQVLMDRTKEGSTTLALCVTRWPTQLLPGSHTSQGQRQQHGDGGFRGPSETKKPPTTTKNKKFDREVEPQKL